MQDHTLTIDTSQQPSELRFAPRFNVAVAFVDRHIQEGRADKVALRGAFGEVTYGDLAVRVNRCGNALKGLGLSPAARVLMMFEDGPEFFYVFWGAIKAGFVPVPVNTLLRSPDYEFMIEDSGCEAVLYARRFAAEVEEALGALSGGPQHVLFQAGDGSIVRSMETASPNLEAAPASPQDDCFWLYSSGSTGRPKGTVHAHRDIPVTCIRYAVDVLGIREDDTFFSAAKLFFAYGLGNGMTFPLWIGATSVLAPEPPNPAMTFGLIERYRPTLYFGVPTLYGAQLRAMEKATPDLSSVRAYVSAGEALPGEIFRRWREETGAVILDGIGSTEILHIFISNSPDDYRAGTSGRIVPGYGARIVDEEGADVAPGASGALMIRGDSIARYYWNNPEKTAATMRGEWIHTGDTYSQDEDGYFVYCGRNDDMMKVGGIWCSPFEIEARLIEHPKVAEAAVVARADADEMIKPNAFVVLADRADACESLADELLEFCKGGLARYKYPRWFHFVDQLPKTATGKIQRYLLRG